MIRILSRYNSLSLRTVPPLANAHTFSASQDDTKKYDFVRTVPTNSEVFGAVSDYAGNVDQIQIQKENWGLPRIFFIDN